MNPVLIALTIALVGTGLLFSMYRRSCEESTAGAEKSRNLYKMALAVFGVATVTLGFYYFQDVQTAEAYLTEPFDKIAAPATE